MGGKIVKHDGLRTVRSGIMEKELNDWWKALPLDIKYYLYSAVEETIDDGIRDGTIEVKHVKEVNKWQTSNRKNI